MKKVLFFLPLLVFGLDNVFADFCSSPKEMQSIYISSKAIAMAYVCNDLGYSGTSAEKAATIMLAGDPTPLSEYKKMEADCRKACEATKTSGRECNKKITETFIALQKVAIAEDKNTDSLCQQLNDM